MPDSGERRRLLSLSLWMCDLNVCLVLGHIVSGQPEVLLEKGFYGQCARNGHGALQQRRLISSGVGADSSTNLEADRGQAAVHVRRMDGGLARRAENAKSSSGESWSAASSCRKQDFWLVDTAR